MTIGQDPKFVPVISGTGRLRKLRFSPPESNRGKRGAFRICYALFREFGVVVLVTLYAKNEKDDLTDHDKRSISTVLDRIQEKLDQGEIR